MLRIRHLILLVAGALACSGGGKREDVPRRTTRERSRVVDPPADAEVVREEAQVAFGGARERWSLVWRRTPQAACGIDDPDAALTCPCTGFAYGEMGVLDLVRRRPGRTDERLPLTPIFRQAEADGPNGIDSLAVLQRWPVKDSDQAEMNSERLLASIQQRPVTRAMTLADYDHDGRATEFLLQVGTAPCGKRQSVLVGVSRADSSVHVFSARGDTAPLVLEKHIWEALRSSDGHATAVEWLCGDHGSETETEVSLVASPLGIGVSRAEYECRDGKRGRRLRPPP